MNTDISNLLKYRFKELKPEFGLTSYAFFGFLYSVWSLGIFFQVCDVDDFTDNFFSTTFKNTVLIASAATALGILYEKENAQQKWFKIWGFVKIVDLVVISLPLLTTLVHSRYMEDCIVAICIFKFILLGMYLMYLVKKIHDQKFPKVTRNPEEGK